MLRAFFLFCWQVATFIVQKILLDDVGLDYICTTAERFFAVGRVLGNMVAALAEQPSSRLLKHIIRCYLRLSDNPRFLHFQISNGSKQLPGSVLLAFNFLWLVICFDFLFSLYFFSLLEFRACHALRSCLPDMLRDATFSSCLRVSKAYVIVHSLLPQDSLGGWWFLASP